MSFQFLDPDPQFFTRDGRVLSGGTLTFYTTGTSNKLNTYTDPSLTATNTNPIPLDASGRAGANIWMNGEYRVVLADSEGAIQWTKDNVKGPGDLPTFSSGQAGYFLSTNGEDLLWVPIRQPPDPSGQIGKILGSDGASYIWQNPPATPPPAVSDITITTIGGNFSDGTRRLLIQTGTATAPNVGGRDTSVAVTFPTGFAGNPFFVGITPRYSGTVSSLGNAPIPHVSTTGPTGFTAAMAAGERDDTGSGFNFNAAIPFDWFAIGLIAV